MALTNLWLVRHGESIGNVTASRAESEGLRTIPLDVRDADVPLSPTGVEQSRALGAWFAGHREAIDLCWVSPYLRARQTLQIAAETDDTAPTPMIVDERLRDRELGILDLLTAKGVAALHPDEAERRRRLGKFLYRPAGGESWADVALRLRSFLADALPQPSTSAVIVAHEAVVMLLLYLLLPLDESELLEFAATHAVGNASVTHLVRQGARWELREFSGVEHLQHQGAPVTLHPGDPHVRPE
ncbi:histidine phosphatase family protein [Microbacterium sp. 22242]|uniref:histidine phosphatase family protein n=1 Tax=Microbacterium sp. 22242 TaxID=3453896 RepID=UPI003F858650